jgi:hypothetical protein
LSGDIPCLTGGFNGLFSVLFCISFSIKYFFYKSTRKLQL